MFMKHLIPIIVALLQGCISQEYCRPIDNTLNVDTTLIKWENNNDISEQMMGQDDIDGWDIPIEQIKTVCIDEFRLDYHPYYLSQNEGIRLVKAFNAIQNKDIYYEESLENVYGGYLSNIVVTLKSGEKIYIGYSPTCQLTYKEKVYYMSCQLKYYDVIRDLYKGIGSFPYIDWETDYFDSTNGVGVGWVNHIIIDPNKSINEARSILGNQKKENQDYTFNDLLDYYRCDLEINDVVETEDIRIKVIEIKENHRVTAVAVEFKE